MDKLFENCYLINLNDRLDRLNDSIKELSKLDIIPIRFNAVRHEKGLIGCALSHIGVLKLAQIKNHEYVLVCEDDNLILNSEELKKSIIQFLEDKIEWDVLLLSANNYRPFDQISNHYIKVKNAQGANAYIVRKHYYETLINIWETAVIKFSQNTDLHAIYANDQYWKILQKKDNWYLIIPTNIIQKPEFSNIEKRIVDYTDCYMNYDKEYYNNIWK
jgi:GR25 family glycosyltransferase involved in LPS biosynthesis